MNGRSGVSRIEEKLRLRKQEKNFYESHQLYVTLNHRYHARNKHEEARHLMVSGALFFLENHQDESGMHLSLLYIESLEKHVNEVSQDDINTLGKLHASLSQDLGDIENFQNRAIRWSASCASSPKTGNYSLRKKFAFNLWKANHYVEARQHFLYSNDGQQFGEMLQEFSLHHGKPEETDLFLAQAVLQLLCIKCVQAADNVFLSYTSLHPKIDSGPPFDYPLINFLSFLLIAVKDSTKGGVAIFTILCEKYKMSIQRDGTYISYLQKIGEHYFGVKTTKISNAGFLENFLQSLMGDDSDDDSEMESSSSNVIQNTMTIEDLD